MIMKRKISTERIVVYESQLTSYAEWQPRDAAQQQTLHPRVRSEDIQIRCKGMATCEGGPKFRNVLSPQGFLETLD